jgi:hypothetical protein
MDASEADGGSIIGNECHIVARKQDGPRGNSQLASRDRDNHENLILLCSAHHKVVDDAPETYSVQYLRDMKLAHEKWVRDTLSLGANIVSSQRGLAAVEVDRRIAARGNLEKARTAMKEGNATAAKNLTEEAIRLSPDLELEARKGLGLWMSIEIASSTLENPIGFSNPLHAFGPQRELPSVSEAIYQLRKAMELSDAKDKQILIQLAKMYGRDKQPLQMLRQTHETLALFSHVRDELIQSHNLALLAYACTGDPKPERHLQALGQLLDYQLPLTEESLLSTIHNRSLNNKNTWANPNIDWFVIGKHHVWAGLRNPTFFSSVRLQLIDANGSRRGHAFFLIPASGPHQHIPSETTEERYVPVEEVIGELVRLFYFIGER